jgi:hypothetical protein
MGSDTVLKVNRHASQFCIKWHAGGDHTVDHMRQLAHGRAYDRLGAMPLARSRVPNFLIAGLWCTPTIPGMYSALRKSAARFCSSSCALSPRCLTACAAASHQ